ncbi:hypothetical protein PHLCEN_2v9634, partial [Hermanssonia centrifuga]
TSSTLPDSTWSPYPNESSFRLGEWYWNDGTCKSQASFKKLVNVITAPDFSTEDIQKTKWDVVDRELVLERDETWDGWEDVDGLGWVESPVTISVPFHKNTAHPGTQYYTLPDNFRHRRLLSALREKVQSADFRHFHTHPYELHWKYGDASDDRVHGELYWSDAFLEAHKSIQAQPSEPGCKLEKVVAGFMFASDATHLTAFGDASLWPLYLAFGNESKYRRSKPSCYAQSHIGYFRKVSGSLSVVPTTV